MCISIHLDWIKRFPGGGVSIRSAFGDRIQEKESDVYTTRPFAGRKSGPDGLLIVVAVRKA
jgi:hypothetical protein